MKINCLCLFPVLIQLIGGLSDEKVRWHESVLAMDGQIVNIVGDVMISSGVIAYLGTFTVSLRLMAAGIKTLSVCQSPCNRPFLHSSKKTMAPSRGQVGQKYRKCMKMSTPTTLWCSCSNAISGMRERSVTRQSELMYQSIPKPPIPPPPPDNPRAFDSR